MGHGDDAVFGQYHHDWQNGLLLDHDHRGDVRAHDVLIRAPREYRGGLLQGCPFWYRAAPVLS